MHDVVISRNVFISDDSPVTLENAFTIDLFQTIFKLFQITHEKHFSWSLRLLKYGTITQAILRATFIS